MKIVIFDIDGTLANLTHRLHLVKNGNRKWDEFFALAKDDRPIWPMIDLLNVLAQEHRILLVSGRTETIRAATEQWLSLHTVTSYAKLYMRPEGDYRKDFIIKKEILEMIRQDFPDEEIAFVVDDRPSVVKMWREEGLTCLQCAEWEEREKSFLPIKKGLLTLMVGPSGAGKSRFLFPDNLINGKDCMDYGIVPPHIVSSDQIRADLCGNFRDQSKNAEVFAAVHNVARTRINSGLPTVIDATNIKRADRLACVALADGSPVRYIVIDRPLSEKLRDAGWRAEVPGLIERHDQTFKSQLKDILKGDGLENVFVTDLRTYEGK